MSSPTPPNTILSDSESTDSPVHSPAPRRAISDMESDPSEEPSEDAPTAPVISPFPDDPYVLARQRFRTFADAVPSESPSPPHLPAKRKRVRVLQPYEPEPFMKLFRYPKGPVKKITPRKRIVSIRPHASEVPPSSSLPDIPPVRPKKTRETARKRTHPVSTQSSPPPSPHPYMLPTHVPPSLPTPSPPPSPSPLDFTPLSIPFELSIEARAAIDRYNALARSPTPDRPTPPRVFETGESSQAAGNRQPTISTLMARMDRHEEQIEMALGHLEELPLERIESMEYRSENIIDKQATIQQELGTLKNGLQETRNQMHELGEQHGQMSQDIPLLYANDLMMSEAMVEQSNDIVSAYSRIAALESIVVGIQVQYQENLQILLNMISELKSRIGGAPGNH